MGLVAQSIPHLLGGVSQQPETLRSVGQHAEQVNGFSDPSRGLAKRPPTVHRARLTSNPAGWDGAFVHTILRDESEQYRVVVANGTVKVFDALTGAELQVLTPNGAGYVTAPGQLRAVTVGDYTILANGGVAVARGTERAPLKKYDAALTVRQAAPGVSYNVTVNGQKFTHTTPSDNTGSATSTEAIAAALNNLLVTSPFLTAAGINVWLFGSTLYLFTNPGADFTVDVTDGLGNGGLSLAKGSVQRFTDLPANTAWGQVVEVTGDPESGKDNYWVTFDGGNRVWVECPEPGSPLTLDPTTMPWALERNGSLSSEHQHLDYGLPQPPVTFSAGPYTSTLGETFAESAGISFDPAVTYPTGAVIKFYYDAPYAFTLVADGTGAAVADLLRAYVTSNVPPLLGRFAMGEETSGTLHFNVAADGSLPPYLGIEVTLDPHFHCADPTATFTPGALVGYTVENLTDGSRGVVTANGIHDLTFSGGLTGGVLNAFSFGDRFRIAPGGGGATYFVLRPLSWTARQAGSLETVPFPSFVGRGIDEVFFTQNRLGFLSGESIVLSASGDLFNLFRQTATQLLEDDPIDVQSATAEVTRFHSAVAWNEGLTLFTESGQYALSGEPALTPTTIRLDAMTAYASSRKFRPVVCGSRLFFGRGVSGSTQVTEYVAPKWQGQPPDGLPVTAHVPTYLPGNPLEMVGDGSLNFVAVRTDATPDTLYVYSFLYSGDEKQQSAWSKWVFPGATLLGVTMTVGVLGLVMKRADGVFLETLDVGRPPAVDQPHQDRLGWTAEVPYEFRTVLSTIYLRKKEGEAETRGRLVLRSLDALYVPGSAFAVRIASAGRGTKVHAAGAGKTVVRTPVQLPHDAATITLSDDTPAGCVLTALDWEGTYTTRSQRV